jgi:drug/metabolite transporter (DMT)-like permease
MSAKKIMVYGIVMLSMAFWSLTYIWYKKVFTELSPVTVMTFRLGISSLMIYLFAKIINKFQIPEKKDFKHFILLSFFQPFLYFLAESYGVSLVSPTVSAVIISTIPLFIPIAAYILFKEKISFINILGFIISFAGVLIIVLGKNLHFEASPKGILFLFVAVLAAVFYSLIITKITKKYNSFSIITWQNIFGTIMFLPLFFIFEYKSFSFENISNDVIINLLYLALFGSSVAYIFFTYGIKNIGIAKTSLFTNLIPGFTAVFAWIILDEHLSIFKIAGILTVIGGLFLGQRSQKRNIRKL